jgi:hypothetical protein
MAHKQTVKMWRRNKTLVFLNSCNAFFLPAFTWTDYRDGNQVKSFVKGKPKFLDGLMEEHKNVESLTAFINTWCLEGI